MNLSISLHPVMIKVGFQCLLLGKVLRSSCSKPFTKPWEDLPFKKTLFRSFSLSFFFKHSPLLLVGYSWFTSLKLLQRWGKTEAVRGRWEVKLAEKRRGYISILAKKPGLKGDRPIPPRRCRTLRPHIRFRHNYSIGLSAAMCDLQTLSKKNVYFWRESHHIVLCREQG